MILFLKLPLSKLNLAKFIPDTLEFIKFTLSNLLLIKIELVKSTLTRGLLEEVDNKLYWPDDNNNLLMRKDEMLKLLQSTKQSSY